MSDNVGTTQTIAKTVEIQTAQANDWSGLAGNIAFTAPDDPGSATAKTEKTVNLTFTVDPDTSETTVTADFAS